MTVVKFDRPLPPATVLLKYSVFASASATAFAGTPAATTALAILSTRLPACQSSMLATIDLGSRLILKLLSRCQSGTATGGPSDLQIESPRIGVHIQELAGDVQTRDKF